MTLPSRAFGAALLFLSVFTVSAVPTGAHDEFRFVGTIARLDLKTSRMTVKWTEDSKPATADVVITATTSVTRAGLGVSRSELKLGLSVVVLAAMNEDNLYDVPEATDIMLVPALKP